MKVLVNGVGIAGATMAYGLRKSGGEVVLVEQAAPPRRLHHRLLGARLRHRREDGAHSSHEGAWLPGPRGALRGPPRAQERRLPGRCLRTIDQWPLHQPAAVRPCRYDLPALNGRVETIFGDSVAGIEDEGRCVRVGFEHAAPREVDLVIGADGLHSRVRPLAFGSRDAFQFPLGYHVAAFEVDGYRPRDELVYVSHGVPGRQVSRFAMREDKTLFLFVFRDVYLPTGSLASEQERKAALASVFADVGWECPRILAAMESTDELYFDRVSQIRMNRWTAGRTALVGDAAACVSLLAGEGTGLAMAEGYVLAGELRSCRGDHKVAFARYQERMMPFLKGKQEAAARFASSFAPKSALGITFRNVITRVLGLPFVSDFFIGRDLRDAVEVPDYGF